MKGIISAVKKNSLAALNGLKAGEGLLAVNGVELRDIIDLSFAAADTHVEMKIVSTDGALRTVAFDKELDEDLGLAFESAVFDGVGCCANNCVFCFVAQMIPGMRKGLYVKDDDYRLSFLYGNFITLTNMTDADFDRIISTHMSPLYVSVHATDPEVRCRMMNNSTAGDLMNRFDRLFKAGIQVHAQIVCCPGYNDGEVLNKTYHDLVALAPHVQTMAVVPVGLTKNRSHLTKLATFTKQCALELVNMVEPWQRECRARLGKSFIYLGDEFYILAGKELPSEEWYDGFPQLENGIGLSRSFLVDWEKAAQVKPRVEPAIKNYVIPVGVSAQGVLQPIIDEFNRAHDTSHTLLPVANEFFGTTVNVTGLLTAGDILRALPKDRPVILPEAVLNSDDLFLDDVGYAEFKAKAGVVVERAQGAAQLYHYLTR